MPKTLRQQKTISPTGKFSASKSLIRQEKILAIVARNDKTQVSDIIKQLPNVTKRTIRRDLDDLIKRGEVARMGSWNQIFYKLK
jgi:predicted HTH transcriptional regulator